MQKEKHFLLLSFHDGRHLSIVSGSTNMMDADADEALQFSILDYLVPR